MIAGLHRDALHLAGLHGAHFHAGQAHQCRRFDAYQLQPVAPGQPQHGQQDQKQDQVPAQAEGQALAGGIEHLHAVILGWVSFFAAIETYLHWLLG
ncbi:hypothetical protein [Pseudomonas sp. OHS18]|uniref:hypothetical protein n=1 Tax=Pseudomonas sp. OHS18 TaxID=3399679 RepID=UPI003A83ACD9